MAVIAPTLGDAVEACVEGPSGLRAHNPAVRLTGGGGGAHVRWPNGTVAKLFGAYSSEDVERLRAGGNRCVVWAEELAAWIRMEQAWDHMSFGLRLGKHPHVVASTTPKARKLLLDLITSPTTVVSRASTADNPHLDPRVRQRLYDRYAGTRLGRQELEGQVLEDSPGALWKRDRLDECRVWEVPQLQRMVVAIDPSGGEGPENDEQGIAVGGRGYDSHGYLVADLTCKLSPEGWARVAVKAYHDYQANYIVAEKNYGGDMVLATIRSIDQAVPVRLVNASRGKAVRAEPIAALDAQGRIHQVGTWPEMEDELCSWEPDGSGPSPNRLDARVWLFTELMLGPGKAFTSAVGGERPVNRYAVTQR